MSWRKIPHHAHKPLIRLRLPAAATPDPALPSQAASPASSARPCRSRTAGPALLPQAAFLSSTRAPQLRRRIQSCSCERFSSFACPLPVTAETPGPALPPHAFSLNTTCSSPPRCLPFHRRCGGRLRRE
eukprot:8133282-Alexandrium_andersonii.AAC.1